MQIYKQPLLDYNMKVYILDTENLKKFQYTEISKGLFLNAIKDKFNNYIITKKEYSYIKDQFTDPLELIDYVAIEKKEILE